MNDDGRERRARERALQVAVGERMRWARELVQPNLSRFARLIGYPVPKVSKVETGAQPIDALLIREYANRLRVTTDYILFGRIQSATMDFEMAWRLLEAHPQLRDLQNTGSSHPGTAH